MSALKVITEWVRIELYCKNAYERLASMTDNPYARSLFQWLSQACGNHAQYLRKTLEVLGWQLPQELLKPKRPSRLQSRRYGCDVEEVYWTAKEYLTLEEEMKKTYSMLSTQINNSKARDILDQMIKEEEGHYSQLSQLVQVFEQTYTNLREETSQGIEAG